MTTPAVPIDSIEGLRERWPELAFWGETRIAPSDDRLLYYIEAIHLGLGTRDYLFHTICATEAEAAQALAERLSAAEGVSQ